MKHRKQALAWIIVSLLSISLACNLPMSTKTPTPLQSVPNSQTNHEILTTSGDESVLVSSAQAATVSTNGAILSIPNGAIPADAADQPSIEEVSLMVDANVEMILSENFVQVGPVYQLGPDGLTFGMPPKLTMPIPDSFDIDLVLGAATYDQAEGSWKLLPADIDSSQRTITVQTGHFSYYGIFGIADYIQDGKTWAARNGGWIQITNTYRDARDQTPFGKQLPASMYYGVCVQYAYYDDPNAHSWNWTPPTDWMIGASAVKDTDATRQQWLPTGTYTLMEFYGVSETNNWDFNYYPEHRYYVRPMGQVRLNAGDTLDFTNYGKISELEMQGFTISRHPCWEKPLSPEPIVPGNQWTSVEIINTHRHKTTQAPFGKNLPAGVYYGVCSIEQDYERLEMITGNWLPPLNWMMGAVALTDQNASNSYTIPAGDYNLLEFYLLTEQDNYDFNYVPTGEYFYRPLGRTTLAGGDITTFISPVLDPEPLGDWRENLTAAGFIGGQASPCQLDPIDVPPPQPTATVEAQPKSGCQTYTIPLDGVWDRSWWETGLMIYPGDEVIITATGTVYPSLGNDVYAGPDGTYEIQSWVDDYTFLPDLGHEAVLIKIGSGEPVFAGESLYLISTDEGLLAVGVNDTDPGNNSGSFDIEVCWNNF